MHYLCCSSPPAAADSSSIEHKQIIEDNDPNARNKFYIIK